MAKTVVGLMDTHREAQDVVQDLINNGFSRDSISLMASEAAGGEAGKSEGAQRAEGAAKGAGTGAAIGGVAGLLIGLTGLAIPGIGPIIAAGPLASALAGAGIGAVAGGAIGALTKMGVPEKDAEYYAEGVRRGGFLIAVATDDASADRAADVMRRHGAVDIDKRAEHWRKAGWKGFDEKAGPYTQQQMAKERETVLPVVEEEVQIGKQQVSTGGVRVYSHVTEQPVEEEVRLREERARVQRRPADRPATAAEREAFRETSFEVRETAEEPVITKQARVKEEVVVGKEATERTETVRETARRTDVEVEEAGARPGAGATILSPEDEDFQTHFRSYYAGRGEDFESYRSAYHYAETASRDRRFQGKEWTEVEEDIHRDWDKSHPGTWSRVKEAIHYGWDKVKRH